jgi:mRNA interferase RelE/StbE
MAKTTIYSVTAARSLRAHANRATQIMDKIQAYATDPTSQTNNIKTLQGVDAKRLRVGSFRVIFTESAEAITVLDIGPRSGIYD